MLNLKSDELGIIHLLGMAKNRQEKQQQALKVIPLHDSTISWPSYFVFLLLGSSNRFAGRVTLANSHDNTDQLKSVGPGPVPIIPSPIPPTPVDTPQSNAQHPFPSAAYSHLSNTNSASGITTDYSSSSSAYSQRNPKGPSNNTEAPSLAQEILSNLRSNKRSDGLPATML